MATSASAERNRKGRAQVIVVMGVSGSGKTTVGRQLAARLGWPFYDGDDFHPPENVQKMASGEPLTDADRRPWLEHIARLIGEHVKRGHSAVIACSALKGSYRRRLRQGRERVIFVYLEGDFDLIRQRMETRADHFMGAEMLRSQFAALEPPAVGEALTVSAAGSVGAIVNEIVQQLGLEELSMDGHTRKKRGFVVYPAIDLRQGRVVRLERGDPERQTVFGDDPKAVAERWVTAGARWLHVVNLDGAFQEGGAANWKALATLTGLGVKVQFGGGLRSLEEVKAAFGQGVARVVLGTAAVESPEMVAKAVDRFGAKRVAVGIDARDGTVRTRGWQAEGGVDALALAQQMADQGVTTAVHTDIVRDGVFAGVNAAASAELARASGLNVIASGGVASVEDVRRAAAYAEQGVIGVITGRALYEGRLDLAEALEVVQFPGNSAV